MDPNLQRVAWQHRRPTAQHVAHGANRAMLSSAFATRTRVQIQRQGMKSSSHAVRTLASAATSSQKRALNPDQLKGKAPPSPPAASKASAVPSSAPASATKAGGSPAGTLSTSTAQPSGPSSVSSSSSGPFPVMGLAAAGAVVALGGGAYYYAKNSRAPVPASPALSAAPAVAVASKDAVAEKAATASAELAAAKAVGKPSVVREVEPTPSPLPAVAAAAVDEPIGHRVVAIQVPEKMKGGPGGGASAPVPVVAHPPDGHRVAVVAPARAKPADAASSPSSAPPPARPPLVEETSMTQRALVQLQTATLEQANEAVVAAHQSLWSSGAADAVGDESGASVADGSAAHLQAKVARLASELAERTKWEAVRLKEFLAMKEQETAQKYQELLQTQRLEFEDILARRLREQEHALTTQFQQAIADKEASVQTLLQTALDTQQAEHENDKKAFEQLKAAEIAAHLEQDFGQKLEQYKAGVAQELERKVATLTELSKQLASLESALAASKSSREGSVKAHKLSATALALSQKLETSQPAGTELLALQAAAGEKGVIPAALKTIPTAVYSQGAATVPELQARFDDVYRQCRRAALVPEGRPGLEGQLAGIVFSSLKYPPGPDDPAPEDHPDHPEYVLVRAKRHVQLGEIEKAVEQLEKLQGQVAFTASDWKTSALHRVAVEKALKVIKLECALVNESLVE